MASRSAHHPSSALDLLTGGEPGEAKVERARDEDVRLRRLAPVPRHRRGEVRVDDERVLPQQVLHLAQRIEDLDVRIEVGDPLDAGAIEQMAQQPRLDRGRELEHAVPGRHLVPGLDRELVRPHDLERLDTAVDLAVDVVDHQRPARTAGIVECE